MILKSNRIALSSTAEIRRIPPRPSKSQQSDYKEKFDYLTLFSDAFTSGDRVLLIGPPLLNLEEPLRQSTFIWNEMDVSEKVEYESFDRMSRVSFQATKSVGTLTINGPLGRFDIKVNSARNDLFAGESVLVTEQKNNRLEWIAYWVFFNARINDVTSFVIYDNKSTNYSLSTLEELFRRIPGVRNWVIVDCDTPYGPTGGPDQIWDSDFGQYICWEHARQYFLRDAAACMCIDIDELPITVSGKSIFAQLRESGKPAMRFRRQPIVAFPSSERDQRDYRTHSDYVLGDDRGAWLNFKYAFMPNRLSQNDQLKVHELTGEKAEAYESPETFAGHFEGIRVDWRSDQTIPVPEIKKFQDIGIPVSSVEPFRDSFGFIHAEWQSLVAELEEVLNQQC